MKWRETQHGARVSFHQLYVVIFVSAHSGTGFGIKTKPFPEWVRNRMGSRLFTSVFHVCVVCQYLFP